MTDNKNQISRRDLLAATLAGGLGLAAAGCSSSTKSPKPSTAAGAAKIAPAGSDIGAIEHVVVLMQENRSFDHYFGTYKSSRGFSDPVALKSGVFSQVWPGAPAGFNGHLLPFHLNTQTQMAECTADLSHSWGPQHECWNQGKMDAFVSTHTSPQVDGATNGILTMGYYERADIPFHFSLADNFTLCDSYHCSVMGPTHPNRLMSMTGMLDPTGEAGGPILITNLSSQAEFSVSWTTVPELLSKRSISWKVYNPIGPQYKPGSPLAMAISNNILLYFKQYQDPTSTLYSNAFNYSFEGDFAHDVATDNLPAVSWVLAPLGYDEHPPAPPSRGGWFIDQVLSALSSNPKLWAKTAVFITYDENDGFFDHVAPPVAPAGTAGEYVTVSPLPANAQNISGPIGLGFRVPMIVASPFSTGGYINSDLFDHTSILRFLETRFGISVPNISAWRRKTVGDLTSTLSVTRGASSMPELATTSQDSPAVQRECQANQLNEIPVPMAQYPVTAPQTMPAQAT